MAGVAADELTPLVGLAQGVGEALRNAGLSLATAESCTGGLVGHLLTEIPGSSDYYLGGLVSYSDDLKQRELGVDASVLEHHGAVSAQTCVAMAEGARHRYGASVAVAVTGIAGPGGGSDAKPVGLTYVAVADPAGHDVERHQWSGDRHANKIASAEAALKLVMARLSK
ncbi:MAG: CinA family protein [Chloroflexota bacterium]